MHEYSLVQSLIDRVESAVAAQEGVVREVRVQIGELAGVEPELLATAFETFRAGTVCAEAKLEIERTKAAWICPRCKAELAAGSILRCTACDLPARLASGGEITLLRVEMEVPDV